MCLMCDITGRDYYHNHSGNNSAPIKTRDNNNSEKTLILYHLKSNYIS